MLLSDTAPGRTAKPLFIGSIPIAASNPAPRLVRQKPNCQGAGYFPNMCVVARTALKLRVKLNCRSILQTAAKDSDQVPRRRFTKQKSPGVCMRDQTMTQERPKGIKWNATIFMALFHIGAVAALFRFSWRALLVSILLWWITASLGVGMGFHRLLTHRGYKTPTLVEYFLTLCGTLTLEAG